MRRSPRGCSGACFRGAGDAVAGRLARLRPHAADAFRIAPGRSGASCGTKCRLFVSANGAITADTPRDFELFAQDRDLAGASVVLDSDGGSVHGAIALGRAIRKLGLDTTVGRTVDLDDAGQGLPRAKLSPRADCESMCAFVLVAGVHRFVPPQARVMVHQIWLGDRREDPTAATYSAEDLVLVQRDIGKLARYTAEMGASIELLDLALRIPPWEPMHALTQAEIADAGRDRREHRAGHGGRCRLAAGARHHEQLPRMTDGVRASAISEQRWAVVDRKGSAALARSHPLTIGGEEIGSFDLMVACGPASDSYDVSYIERRRGGRHAPLPGQLDTISVAAGSSIARLKVVSTQRRSDPDELVTYASAAVPAELIGAFAGVGNHSMMVTTKSDAILTAIRLGNTGAQQSLPQLAAACRKGLGDRASSAGAPRRRIGLGEVVYSAACLRLASIWSSAETTASKVSMVEAWRAL